MYIGTGKNVLQPSKFKQIYQHCHMMALTPPKGGSNNPEAPYDAWIMDSWNHQSHHMKLNAIKGDFDPTSADIIIVAQSPAGHERGGTVYNRFTDWCAAPAHDDADKFDVFGTINFWPVGGVEHWTWDTNAKTFTPINWIPTYRTDMTQLRIAAGPTLVEYDPDRNDLIDKKVEASGPLIYVALQDRKEILVIGQGIFGYVPIPMAIYKGIATDSRYLWMYGDHGFACATHASVISCIEKKRPMPLWLGNGQNNNVPNVIDLSFCEDGTLPVSANDRLATSVFHVDFKIPGVGEGERLIVDKWETISDGPGPDRVQKLPIFAWSLLESRTADLAPKKPARV